MGPSSRQAPGGSVADAANTGRPATPAARYSAWLAAPSRGPSTRPLSSTTVGWNVNGTCVKGSGTLICAAAAVRAAKNSTATARAVGEAPASPRAAIVSTSVADRIAIIGGIVYRAARDYRPRTSRYW